MTTIDYRYDECGLDNVILKDLATQKDDSGEDVVYIPNINMLHRALTMAISAKPSGLVQKELRFIRTELGLTQAELAQIVGKDAQTIGRWERGENPIDPSADTIIRVLALQHLNGGQLTMAVEDLSRRSVVSSSQLPYVIDASNPADYKLVA